MPLFFCFYGHNSIVALPVHSTLAAMHGHSVVENDDDYKNPETNELRSSPSARAFFAALDGIAKNEDRIKSGSDEDDRMGPKRKCSSLIQKRILTLGWRNRYSQEERYPIQIGDTTFSVAQVQRGELDGTHGTGATVWPASVVLLKFLQRHADTLIRGKRIVDLGAGTGVTSIAAAILGASHCVCTDGEDAVVRLAWENIQSAAKELQLISSNKEKNNYLTTSSVLGNGPTLQTRICDCPIAVEKYWWGTGQIEASEGNDCDVILVSDCVLPKLYPIAPLVEALDQLIVSPGSMAILSYEHRYFPEYDPRDRFRELCFDKNLVVQIIPLDQQDPVYSVDDVEIWHVVRQR